MNDKIGFHARSSSDSFLVLGPGGLAASKSAEITDNRPSNEVSAAMQKAEGELKHFDEEAEDKQQQQQEEAEPLLERFRKDGMPLFSVPFHLPPPPQVELCADMSLASSNLSTVSEV